MASAARFNNDVNFCPRCGSILPGLGPSGGLSCIVCKHSVDIRGLEDYEVKYTVNFNSRNDYKEEKELSELQKEVEGPSVERKCPKCGNETMTYASLQLRSADEGQTVFYTCPKCRHKETENS